MDRNHQAPYPDERAMPYPQERDLSTPQYHKTPPVKTGASNPYAPPPQDHMPSHSHSQSQDFLSGNKYRPLDDSNNDLTPGEKKEAWRLDKKWQKRLYWIVPIGIVTIAVVVLFEVYKSDFERWVKPLADWLRERNSWSWVIPVGILFILSFPPLFGHEVVQIVVGLTYPLGVALAIACAGAILGEAGCFVVFKYGFSGWVEKKIATKIKWAAVARVTKEAGFRGVLVIRYSIVPPHLANPLFACTGMAFWLYMVTVILSLPKTLVFVALGTPSSEGSKVAKYGKVVAIAVVVIVSLVASWWIRKKMAVATAEIEQERGALPQGGDFEMLGGEETDTSYRGANGSNRYKPGDSSDRV